ncbi:sugar ABC transporter substrate-binding protein [Ruficoccus amylovorans]|uniref:sn-glycerol-3-phosphate-binding periplasmic protein UgpB n=1 Tax=Ruficoccus amylovorans TaxID=1804625 RepID=A0A842HD10_9BACT|nr:sugar ABC transporter substrate-binding protein [Ruficoccus amylovorans]MBC2593477.1 sugar ABC transporter substrate-binding protein [Ruficoccus amylovorans]
MPTRSSVPSRCCLLVWLLLSLVCLFGCERSNQRPRLVVLTPGGDIRLAVDKAVERFLLAHPEVDVEVVSTPSKNYYVKSLTMLAGNASVDLLWMGQGFGMFATRGALLDLNPYLEAEGVNPDEMPIRPPVLDWYRLDGHLYGIPYGIDVQAIVYNRELVEAKSLPAPNWDWTGKDLMEMGRKLTRSREAGGTVVGLGFQEFPLNYAGLSLLDPSAERFALNTPEGLSWLKTNDELIHDEGILQRGSDQESVDRLTGFLNGQIAIIDVMTWDMPQLSRQAIFEWALAPVPQPDADSPRVAWASSAGFSVAGHTGHPELASELLRYLTDEEFQRDLFNRTIPASPALLDEYIAWQQEHGVDVRPLVAMLSYMQPEPRLRALNEVEAEWEHWKELALNKKISPEEALSQAEKGINRILEFHRKEISR